MIPQKYTKLVFSFFMALMMSCIMSLVVTTFNIGLVDGLFQAWLKSWGFAFIVAFPTINVVAPIVQKLVQLVIKNQPSSPR
ncbi:DUF2798 domain-containing protein [Thalassotalea atypica]|uniref:DUF2798 domain-containing protein n=1 Tax=Thalassotalea atypica TaxID=2054316 RepID=UPI0025732838|nr:DUF2798 domain-containing protein [Thalassotalea atypica]